MLPSRGPAEVSFGFLYRRTVLWVFTLGIVASPPQSVAAQSKDEALLRIAAAPDTTVLRELSNRLLSSLPQESARRHVLVGFSALRRHSLVRSDNALRAARSAFDRAIDLDPANALARYGLGLAHQSEPEVADALIATGRSWSRIFGFDHRSRARRAFERALDLDPGLAGAAVGLAEIALLSRDTDELTRAHAALARTLARRSEDPAALITLGRVAAALGDSATALSIANRLTVAASPAAALHSLLWVLAPVEGREEDVGEAFYRLVDSADATTLERLHRELQPILSAREEDAWEEGDLETRRALLRGGWEARATLAGTSVSERIAEHWRRLDEAVRRYPRQVVGPPPTNSLTSKRVDSPFDDRGAIYVRHGEPIEALRTWDYDPETVVVPACMPPGDDGGLRKFWLPSSDERTRRLGTIPVKPMPDVSYNESWMYREPDGSEIIYHFGRCHNFPDYVLLYHVPCNGRWISDGTRYGAELGMCGPQTDELRGNDARAALASDSHRPHFDRQLPVIFDLLAFRGADGLTDLVAPIAVTADSLTPRVVNGETVYGVGLTVAVVDSAGTTSRVDTTVIGRSRGRIATGQMLRTHVQLSAPPSEDAQLRLTVRGSAEEGEGNFYGTQMRVPDYAGDSLQISSIVLAMPEPIGTWRRGDHSLTLMPLGQFEGGGFRVFYEAYGLDPDQAYVTEIDVEPTGRLGPAPLRLRFQDFASPEGDGVVRDIRRVETGLPPGRYRITVQITDPVALRSARADREFIVVGQPPGRDGST